MEKQRKINLEKLTLAGIFVAIAVVGSLLQVPVLGSKCAPIQHLINILGALYLGPWYAVAVAFAASLIRNLLGLGTLLAFPGSMCGAFLAGILYRKMRKRSFAYLGEMFGTAVLGGVLAYPAAVLVVGRETAIFGLVIPFFISSTGGTLLAIVLVNALGRTGLIRRAWY